MSSGYDHQVCHTGDKCEVSHMELSPVGKRGVTGVVRYSGGGVPFRVSPWNTSVLVHGYCDIAHSVGYEGQGSL